MNSKKGRGKRFLAGFLALLMAVTLLPANVAGVAYAEELDAIEAEAPDGVAAANEETEAAESVLEAGEPQVNEGESSEGVEPEAGLTVDALEEVVPELEAAVAVASEEVLEPAEVSAAVDTTKYEEIGTGTTWEFTTAYYEEKEIGNTSIAEGTDLDGIIVTASPVNAKTTENGGSISVGDGGQIDIPINTETEAVVIEITLTGTGGNDNERAIAIGSGDKKDTVYQKGSDAGKHYFSSKVYTNETLYTKEDEVFSDVLPIVGIGGENKIRSIVLHEYKEKVEPVALTDAAVDLSVGTDKAKTAVYTGEPISLNVVVTKPGEGDATTLVNPKAYTKSFLRETDTVDEYAATEDFTTVGKIKVKVTSIETSPTEAESNVFEITQATLTKHDKEVSIAAEQKADYVSAELDLTTLIEPLSEEDTFTYTLVTDNGYVAGGVVSGDPTIEDDKLKYAVDQSADSNSEATVLVVKVESKNYEDAYIKVTVSIADKPTVTVSGNSVTHTYDGAAYGFKAKATIAVTGLELTGDDLNAAIEDIKEHLTYKFTKVVNGTPDETTKTSNEPTDAGVYKVTAELSDESDYAMTQYYENEDTGYVTLTINPKTITVKPNDITWDKILKDHPVPPETVKATDYTCDGLLGNDELNIANMTIKYCKHGTKTEMTESEWANLGEDDVVDIVADGATASDNYKIEFAVGTINVMIRTVTQITALTAKKTTFLATDVPTSQINADSTVKKDTLVNGFLLTGESSKVDTPKSAVAAGYPSVSYTKRLKSGPSGNQYLNSVGFTIEKAANLYVVAAADSSSDKRPMALYKLNEDTNEIEECVNTKYSINVQTVTPYDNTYVAYDSTAKTGGIELTDSTTRKADYLNIELTEAGTYYLAAAASGIVFYEVSVTYKDDDPDYNITIDESKVATGGATVTEGNKKTAKANETVALDDVVTVTVNPGFELKGYEVKAGSETVTVSANNTFTMPASNVSVAPIVMAEGAVAAPTARPASGATINVNDEIELTAETGASIRYTIDGTTEPTATTGELYGADNKPKATAVGTLTVKAIAYKTAADETVTSSSVETFTYTVTEAGTPSTVTLTGVTLSGEAKVGKMLTANLTFDPAQATVPTGVTYQWYRGSDPISGATTKSYTLTAEDEGKTVKVVVTYGETTKDATSDTVASNTSKIKNEGIEIEFDEGSTYIYTGAKITPSITVYNNGTPLVEGTDYTVKYTNNVNASHKVENGVLTATQTNEKKLPTVTVTGKGALSKKATANFNIVPKALDNDDYESAANADTVAKVSAGASAVESKKVTPVLLYGGAKLAVKKNFEYAESAQKDKKDWSGAADEEKLKLNGVNNFMGTIEIPVSVVAKADQANAKIKADFKGGKDAVKNLYYNGTPYVIEFDVSTKGGLSNAEDATDPLVENTDYVISYPEDLTNVGSKKVTITGISSRCTGSVTKTYKVIPANKNGGVFKVDGVDTVNGYDYVSTGVTFDLTGENAVTVKYVANSADDTNTQAVSADGESLVPGKDFKISYSNNKKVGTAKYTVTGLGNYKGVVLKNQEFKINGISLTNQNTDLNVTVADVFYNKKGAYKSVPYVTVNGKLLKASEYVAYYTVEGENEEPVKNKTRKIEDENFADNATSLTVTVTIEAKGKNVVGPDESKQETKKTATFNIIKRADGYDKTKDLSKAKITFYGGETKNKIGYTGNAVYPTKMEIKLGSTVDTVDLDATGQPTDATKKYTIVYADNVAKGKATAVVTADDGSDYVGGKAGTFNIVPKVLDTLPEGEGFITSFMKGLFNK